MATLPTYAVSPRLELFLALAAVLEEATPDSQSDDMRRWLGQARRRLDQGFRRRLGERAQSPAFWRHMAALELPRAAALAPDVETVIETVAALAPERFRIAGDPEAAQMLVVDALRRFDRLAFAALWRAWREELAGAGSWLDARLGALPIDARAKAVAARVFLPSRFAPPGFFATADGGQTVLLPFDPDRLPAAAPRLRPPVTAPASPDPAAVFRALGDATRYTIAGMLAREPMTSAELARRLEIAKPTMAHHLRALRAAGLVREAARGASIVLTLDRGVLEALSEAAVAQFFGPSGNAPIRRSRRSV